MNAALGLACTIALVGAQVIHVPLSKMPATPLQIARQNGLVGAADGPAEVPINDFQNAQYYGNSQIGFATATSSSSMVTGFGEEASCTGSADPGAGVCYQAKELGETVKVDLKSYAGGKGTLSIAGSGLISFTCADHQFTKTGQDIVADLSDCLPDGITLESVKYCSDSDSVAVTVKDKKVPLPIKTTAKKVPCGEDMMVV